MNIFEYFKERLTNKGMENNDAITVLNVMKNSVNTSELWEKDKNVAIKEYPAVLLLALWYRIQDEALNFIIENTHNKKLKSEFEKKKDFKRRFIFMNTDKKVDKIETCSEPVFNSIAIDKILKKNKNISEDKANDTLKSLYENTNIFDKECISGKGYSSIRYAIMNKINNL